MSTYTYYSVTDLQRDNKQDSTSFPLRDTVEEKLQRIEGYTSGWHFGEGSPMDPGAMNRVRQLHRIGKALGLLADVFPHEDGDVSMMFKAGNHYLEVLCLPDATFSLTLEEGDGHPFTLVKEKENASWWDVRTELVAFTTQEPLWNFSDSFIPTGTARVSDGSHQNAFAIQQSIGTGLLCWETNEESLSSILTASAAASPPNPSVNISLSGMDTPELLGFLSSTGDYQSYLLASRWPERKEPTLTHATEI